MRRFIVALGALFLLLLLGVSLTHPGRVAFKTALLLPEVLPVVPVRPLGWFTAKAIQERVVYSSGDQQIEATVYRPDNTRRNGAIILLLGVNPDMADPVFLRLIEGLAREGVVSLVPISTDLNSGKITLEDVETLIAAFQYLEKQDFVDSVRIGYAGFCIGASLSILAAEDPRISERVAFVNAFGAYYDAFALLEAISSKHIDYDGVHQDWSPNQLTLTVFTDHLLNAVPDAAEREAVRQALSQSPEIARQTVSSLSQEARAVYALLAGVDSVQAREMIALLPAASQESLRRLSPKSALGQARARMLLMVDTGDTYIPFVESRKLAAALPPEGRVYTEFSIFEHVSPSKSPNPLTFVPEVIKLFRHLYLVLLEVA